jgi:hypothetical protein
LFALRAEPAAGRLLVVVLAGIVEEVLELRKKCKIREDRLYIFLIVVYVVFSNSSLFSDPPHVGLPFQAQLRGTIGLHY